MAKRTTRRQIEARNALIGEAIVWILTSLAALSALAFVVVGFLA